MKNPSYYYGLMVMLPKKNKTKQQISDEKIIFSKCIGMRNTRINLVDRTKLMTSKTS